MKKHITLPSCQSNIDYLMEKIGIFKIRATVGMHGRDAGTGEPGNTLARTDLLCMKNAGTQWTMVSYFKK